MDILRIINIVYLEIKELEQGFSKIGRIISGDRNEVYYENTYSDEDITMSLYGNNAGELYNRNKYRYVFKVYNNVETSEEVDTMVSGYIYIISGGFIYSLKLNEVKTEVFYNYDEPEDIDCYSYFAIYALKQVTDIRETGFYKKAPLFGGMDAIVRDDSFDWNKELIEKLINEGKKIE